jgi:hypothetical protein
MKVESRFPQRQAGCLRPEISAQLLKGSDGSPLATLRQCVGGCGAVTCGSPSDSKIPIEKPAAGFPARAFEFLAMVNICR